MRESHPLAVLFPLMGDGELAELTADIAKNGLREPIIVDRAGRIVDGRNREVACGRAGVEPRYDTVTDPASIPALIWSLNGVRRHLTPSQKAAIGEELKPAFATEAKERIRAAGGDRKSPSAKLRDAIPDTGKAVEKAAALVGVSPRMVEQASHLRETKPELFERVKRGELTLAEAARREELAARVEKLPDDEHDRAEKFLHGVIEDGTHTRIAIELAGNLTEMPQEERTRIYVLNESEDPRARSLARTEAAKLPPMPHPALPHLRDASSALAKAARHLDADEVRLCNQLRREISTLLSSLKETAA